LISLSAFAAATQSTIYGGCVASGSAFALAQSAGAAGIGAKFSQQLIFAITAKVLAQSLGYFCSQLG